MLHKVAEYGEGLGPERERLRSSPQPLVQQVETERREDNLLRDLQGSLVKEVSDANMLRLPGRGPVRRVGAPAPRVHRVGEVKPEPLVRRADPDHRLANAIRDGLSCPLGRVATARVDARRPSAGCTSGTVRDEHLQLHDLERPPRTTEQLTEIVEASGILEAHDPAFVRDGPVVAFAPKQSGSPAPACR